jgi:hypothetical protein
MVGKSWLGVWNCRKGSVGRLVGELDLRTSFLQIVKVEVRLVRVVSSGWLYLVRFRLVLSCWFGP